MVKQLTKNHPQVTKTSITVKIYFLILFIYVLGACSEIERGISKRSLPNQVRDNIQELIYDTIKDDIEIKALPFIAYEILDIDEDTFYKRIYLYAMISDIDENLTLVNSYVFPFAFTFDKEKDELIRSFVVLEAFRSEIIKNFSERARNLIFSITQDEYIKRIDNFHNTNMWNAETFYGTRNEY